MMNAETISTAFIEARLGARPLQGFPGALPDTLDEAYEVQNASIARWPDRIAGWKVGGVPAHLQSALGAARLAGPIFRKNVKVQNGTAVPMAMFHGGFGAVEAEIVLQTASDIRPGAIDPTRDDIACLIRGAFIGVELASSPLLAINDLGPLCVVSDFGNNGGLVVGPQIEDFTQENLATVMVETLVDGERVGLAPVPPLEDGALGALRFLIANCANRGLTLEAGTFVSTGAITGIHQVKPGAQSTVKFGQLGTLQIALEAAQPR